MVSLCHLQPADSPIEKQGGVEAARANGVDSPTGLASSVFPVTPSSVNPTPSGPGSLPPLSSASPAGDYGAFFRSTLAPLRRYVSRLVGSREEAQDIAQNAYAKVFTVMQDRKVEHPQALLYTTARHLAIDELKHRGRSPFRNGASVDATISGAPGVEAIVMAREEAVLLEKAINQLPGECRQVLLLRTGEHLTHEQIARRLGLTRKQAEKRLYRAVDLLHAAMQSRPASPTPL